MRIAALGVLGLTAICAAALTAAWMAGYVHRESLSSAVMLWTLTGVILASLVFETRRDRLVGGLLLGGLIGSMGSSALVDVNRVARQVIRTRRVDRFVGSPAPDFSLVDTDGRTHRLEDYRGKTVLVVVWRSWCGPCVVELPQLQIAMDRLSPYGLMILGISNDGRKTQSRLQRLYGLSFPLLIDGDTGQVPERYGTAGAFPSSYLIDVHGVMVREGVYLPSDFDELEEWVRRGAEDLGA